jgi:hypothetical protein
MFYNSNPGVLAVDDSEWSRTATETALVSEERGPPTRDEGREERSLLRLRLGSVFWAARMPLRPRTRSEEGRPAPESGLLDWVSQ